MLHSTHRWLANALALLMGACGITAFSPINCWPSALVSLTLLLLLISYHPPKKAAQLGFIWGIGLFGYGLRWIYLCIEQFGGLHWTVCWILMAILISYLALYPALFAVALRWYFPKCNLTNLCLAAPAIWQLTEWLRGTILTGFPWLQFGYTQIEGPLASLAPIGGVQLITYSLVAGSGFITWVLLHRRWLNLSILFIVLLLIYPMRQISWVQEQPLQANHVTLVQGNIVQNLKWQPEQLAPTLNRYWELTQPLLSKTALIIWPEMAIPDTDQRQMAFLQWLSQQLNTQNHLITGISHHTRNHYYNSLLVLSPSTVAQKTLSLTQYYHKHHLVPFGEFVPFASLIRPLAPLFNLPMSSFSQGNYQQPPLLAGKWRLTPAICYEITLGEQMRANFSEDTDCLVTISNDAWFGDSWGPWQHLQMARMRALELGRPLLRATNTGITAVIDAHGQIRTQLPARIPAVLQASVTPTRGVTPYSYFGNKLIWLLTGVSLLTAWLLKWLTS